MRKKMVARGMRNLGPVSAQSRDEPAAAEVHQAPPQPVLLDESQLSDEDLRFVDEVRSRKRQANTQNAYARLGVSPGATTEQVKSSYLTLAKRFHPDRSSAPGLAGLQPELQSLFGLLKDAYDSISTADHRARYDAQLKAGGSKASSRKEEAGLTLKMGDVLLKKRDFEGAINKLRRSVDLEPTGDALAALAWALVADPKGTPQTKEEAATMIHRALRAPGVTARTYYVAGVLWRTKDPDSAVDAFRKALEVDPQHSDAALELRLIEQRRGKEKKSGGGVLSGLLFGKRKS
jgi:curved DNA-binding protein CbpA